MSEIDGNYLIQSRFFPSCNHGNKLNHIMLCHNGMLDATQVQVDSNHSLSPIYQAGHTAMEEDQVSQIEPVFH